ncbi:efflux RND transporter periplasmic adaptor subunit [Paenibacillus sp. UMB4589-SE434]|uniref:efflux RND transporter periplasmic adaptor subunit n=1 Tax=Paenibacillus sp. UMB4589-SE434 TaxID=3046314 RepID=UPI00255117F9|nr:efflux RND transporter periplasmic adaptor subunit [Paenibacillus sp. UMB4589-SE434]MDK8179949.1 efflux RND transporter periplasmic adaptor subunit [Paenibacillus sp. UMB4589-SE434]
MLAIRRHLLRYLFIAFFGLLAVLTLFSNTFQTMMLPKVTTENAAAKTLSLVIEGSGTITYKEQQDLISDSSTKVTKVHVNKNDDVKKGQVLVTFDNSALKQQLLDEEDGLKRQLLDIDAQREQYIAAKREEDEEALRQVKRELDKQQLSVNTQQRKIDSLRSDLSKNNTIMAPYSGRVLDIQAREGGILSNGSTALTLAKSSAGFHFSFATDVNSSELMQLGESVQVRVKDEKEWTVTGTITKIKESSTPDNQGAKGEIGAMNNEQEDTKKIIEVTMKDNNLKGGEQASMYIDKPLKQQGLVLRKEVLKKDSTGSYVFVVREKKSPLGNTYTAQKTPVKTGSETEDEVIILSGLTPVADIIVEMSEPLQDGNRVRLN